MGKCNCFQQPTVHLPYDYIEPTPIDRKREDSESVIVAPGCVFFGYDEDHSDKSERGKGIMVSAVGKSDWVYKEFESESFVS